LQACGCGYQTAHPSRIIGEHNGTWLQDQKQFDFVQPGGYYDEKRILAKQLHYRADAQTHHAASSKSPAQ